MSHASGPASVTQLLLKISDVFQSDSDLEPMLRAVLAAACEAFTSEGGAIWLLDAQASALTGRYAVGPGADGVIGRVIDARLVAEASQRLGNRSFRWRQGEAADAQLAETVARLARPNTHSLLAAGLMAKGKVLGLITLVNSTTPGGYTAEAQEALETLASYVAIAVHSAWLADQHAHAAERQALLDQVQMYFQETLELEELISRIFQEVNKAIQAQGQSIWLIDEAGQTATCKYATGLSANNVMNLTVPLDKSIVGSCILTQQPVLVEDAQTDARLYRRADAKTGLITRTLMSVPMVRAGASIGALQAINKRNDEFFTQDDLFLFNSIASSAALAIENARLYRQLQASYDLTLFALTAALDLRDRETEGHSQRVVAYTLRLARAMGMSSEAMEHLRRGALLHDVGKIGVPDRILLKPGALDPEERQEIEKHPQKGYEMLLGIAPLEAAIQVVVAHHERWDGRGYPFGLKGSATPVGARMFSVADTFDALTSDRPYRARRPYEVARDIIAAESGKQFDPEVVTAFLSVPKDEWEEIRANVMTEVERRRQRQADLIRSGHAALLNAAPPDAHAA